MGSSERRAGRVLSARLGHETNTFAATPTTLDDFKRGAPPDWGSPATIRERVAGTRTVHGGYLDGARRHGLVLEPLLSTFATPSGLIERDAYDFLKALLLTRIREAGSADGILLDLHGAMVAEHVEDAEGDLIAGVRGLVGAHTPIVVTLDLHANVTKAMATHADVIIGFDEYPHTDMYERGVEAADAMAGILRGALRPALAYRQVPLITMPPKQCTLRDPMRSLIERAHAIERDPKVVNVTLAMGFPFADIRDAGVSVLVTTNGDDALAREKAEEMAGAVWERREEFDVALTPVEEAIEAARAARGLVVLADGSDNPGGGGPCDGTVLLKALIDAGVESVVVAVIADPEAVEEAIAAGVGNRVSLRLGGKTDDRHGAPLPVTGTVKLLSDGEFVLRGPMARGARAEMGRTAVLVIGGVEVVVTERRIQPYDAALLRSVGIEPTARRIVALKSAVHFRSTYQEIAERIFDMDTPGVHRPDFASYAYKKLRPGVYPVTDR